MSQENTECSICLTSFFGNDSWTLPCRHTFHSKCIRAQYKANKNQVDEETLIPLTPTCPLCRARIHRKDLPRGHEVRAAELLEPAYCSLPAELRPVRLTRITFLLQRQRRREALIELIERRNIILARQQANTAEAQSNVGNSGTSDRASECLSSKDTSRKHEKMQREPEIPKECEIIM